MKYGVLGTGMVGQALAPKIASLGNEVMMGTRTADNKNVRDWAGRSGARLRIGTFEEAAQFGETLLNCTQGAISLDVLRAIGRKALAGKTLIDVANPLDMSQGMPPTLTICNKSSLGESIQREFPETKVIKTLNTVNCLVMIEPTRVKGAHDLFICGNDAGAKKQVIELLRQFGWQSVIDLGDITNARATEQLLPIWIRLFMMYGTGDFNFNIVRS